MDLKILRSWCYALQIGSGHQPEFQWVRYLFLKGFGIISLIAFISFWVQAEGLIGSDGILPVKQYLNNITKQIGYRPVLRFPTLFWLHSGDIMIHLLSGAGVVASLLLILHIAPALSSLFIWVLYLSLCIGGQVFMQFQWDNLLIETAFLTVFLAPWSLSPYGGHSKKVNWISIWLLRLLLFKLIFESGIVKLASGDPTWSNFTALQYHFFTQPLPTVFGWFAHQLPDILLRMATFVSLVIELAVPLLIITTRKLRQWAGLIIGSLMLLIGLTGNYGFFNLLGLLLCLSLFDDRALKRVANRFRCLFDGWTFIPERSLQSASGNRWKSYLLIGYVTIYLLVSVAQMMRIIGSTEWIPQWGNKIARTVQSARTINNYGLFANMTTQRPEIIVQGSRNAQNWETYEFKYKPGAVPQPPTWVQPHMPRLDWQMWFAALGSYRRNPWFVQFLVKLLKGKPPVLHLLKTNPYPNKPPRYIRAVRYRYTFTSLDEWWDTGHWWKRKRQELYVPPFSLQQVR